MRAVVSKDEIVEVSVSFARSPCAARSSWDVDELTLPDCGKRARAGVEEGEEENVIACGVGETLHYLRFC